MKKKLLAAAIGLAFMTGSTAQTIKNYRNFPLVVAVQFHNISMPFKDLGSNFSNIGFRVGTEVSWNGKQNWAQGFSLSWYHNRNAGNGIMAYTETIYRPSLFHHFFGEIKTGAGISHSFHPVDAYRQEDGFWVNEGRKGKTMLVVPVTIGFGYNGYRQGRTCFSPFVNYGLLLQRNYNRLLPVMPNSLIQIGTRIHFINN